jgi:hypothetical protein
MGGIMYKVYKLNADNFEDVLITKEAFKEWVEPSMSTGDWHTHKKAVVQVKTLKGVITADDLRLEYEETLVACAHCGRVF